MRSGINGCRAEALDLPAEQAPVLGGGTVASYGSPWIPSNPIAIEAGLEDNFEEAMAFGL
jgi:hypothetical protein